MPKRSNEPQYVAQPWVSDMRKNTKSLLVKKRLMRMMTNIVEDRRLPCVLGIHSSVSLKKRFAVERNPLKTKRAFVNVAFPPHSSHQQYLAIALRIRRGHHKDIGFKNLVLECVEKNSDELLSVLHNRYGCKHLSGFKLTLQAEDGLDASSLMSMNRIVVKQKTPDSDIDVFVGSKIPLKIVVNYNFYHPVTGECTETTKSFFTDITPDMDLDLFMDYANFKVQKGSKLWEPLMRNLDKSDFVCANLRDSTEIAIPESTMHMCDVLHTPTKVANFIQWEVPTVIVDACSKQALEASERTDTFW